MSGRVRVKVCCIQDEGEARLAVAEGASALGLVSAMPSGPGVIDDDTIARLARIVPPGVDSFLLTSRRDGSSIVEQERRARCSVLQLVDAVEKEAYSAIRSALPGVRVVQVIHVTGPEAVAEATAIARHVDALLLDSGDPTSSTKELGGTGRTHDWKLSRRIVDGVGVPVFLAGGLTAANVREAVATVRPYGVDVCSGVRTYGRLDPARLGAFFQALAG